MRNAWENRSERPSKKRDNNSANNNELNSIVKTAVKLLRNKKKKASSEENCNIEEVTEFEDIEFSDSDNNEWLLGQDNRLTGTVNVPTLDQVITESIFITDVQSIRSPTNPNKKDALRIQRSQYSNYALSLQTKMPNLNK